MKSAGDLRECVLSLGKHNKLCVCDNSHLVIYVAGIHISFSHVCLSIHSTVVAYTLSMGLGAKSCVEGQVWVK